MNDATDVIAVYRPDHRRIAPEIWEQTRDIAREAVRLGGAATVNSAIEDFRAITSLLEFALLRGYGTDMKTLLVPSMVEHYFEAHLLKQKVRNKSLTGWTANTYRSRLRRLGRKLNPTAWPPAPKGGHRATLLNPYDGDEIRLLLQQASVQKTPQLCDAMTTVICLAGGAGLTAGEIARCHEDDLDWDTDNRLLIHVRGDGNTIPVTPRTVPVLTALGLADRLMGAAGGVDSSGLLIGQWGAAKHDPFGKIIERFHIPAGVPRLNTRRLRNTWLLALMTTRGLLVSDIMRLAGLVSAKSIEDLAQLIEPADDANALAAQAGWWLER